MYSWMNWYAWGINERMNGDDTHNENTCSIRVIINWKSIHSNEWTSLCTHSPSILIKKHFRFECLIYRIDFDGRRVHTKYICAKSNKQKTQIFYIFRIMLTFMLIRTSHELDFPNLWILIYERNRLWSTMEMLCMRVFVCYDYALPMFLFPKINSILSNRNCEICT